MTPAEDNPLEWTSGSEPFGSPVIDLGDMRVKFGMSRRGHRACKHLKLVYNTSERRVWCEDCERDVDGFDAFMVMTREFHDMVLAARGKQAKVDAALAAVVIRRGAKAIDKAWGRHMAPCCPSCRTGLLPEDFADGGMARVSLELERARRAKKTAAPGLATPPSS